jgi:CubicO group peptidase (beta-lactamase class C family)
MTNHEKQTRGENLMKAKIIIGLLAIIAFLNLTGAWPTTAVQANRNAEPLAFEKTFDINLFEQNIRKALDNKSIGYSYAINLNGQFKKSGANGYAVLKRDIPGSVQLADPKGLAQSASKRMNIASVTKTITATTVLKILQDKLAKDVTNLTLDSKVNAFLPASWKRGPGVTSLTFKELLSQLSGMNLEFGTDIEGLKNWIATGVTRPKSEYKYKNANLAIFRIIIPYMLSSAQIRKTLDAHAQMNLDSFNALVSNQYVAAVNHLVLQPMGILNASCKSEGDFLPTRLYSFPDNKKKGTLTDDWTLVSGGGGWYLSAVNLAQFLAHLRYNNKILTPATRKLMDDNMLGWRIGGSYKGIHGLYLAHGGGLNYGTDAMTSCIMNYPNGVQVALLINSAGTFDDKYKLLGVAFDNAWVAEKAPKP